MPANVSSNLEAFAKHLIEIIEKKPERLLNAFIAVQKEYDGAKEIPILGWLYAYTRGRSKDLKSAIDDLSSFDSPLHRLNAFQNFILSGHWTTSSSNTLLLTVLIGYGLFDDAGEAIYEIVPTTPYVGYEAKYIYDFLIENITMLLKEQLPHAISAQEECQKEEIKKEEERLAQEERERIEAAEREQAAQEKREREEKERLEQQLARERMLKTIELVDEPASAQAFMRDNEKWIFQLSCKERPKPKFPPVKIETKNKEEGQAPKAPESKWIWRLTWYDSAGKANLITPNRALQELLDKIPEASLLEKNINAEINKSPELDEIKIQCVELAKWTLERIKILVEPSGQELKKALTSYVLVQEDEQPILFWYDSFGKKELVDLEQYPDIIDCAKKHFGFLEQYQEDNETAQNFIHLKTHLQHVRICREINSAAKNTVHETWQKKVGITLLVTENLETIPPMRILDGIYVLIREKDEQTGELSWCLLQRKNRAYHPVAISKWAKQQRQEYEALLEKHTQTSLKDLNPSEHAALKNCIEKSKQTQSEKKGCIPNPTTQLKIRSCIALDVLPPEDKREPDSYILTKRLDVLPSEDKHEPDSDILTKTKETWELYYINRVKEEICIDLKAYPAIGKLIDEWKGKKPIDLEKGKLDSLSELLVSLIPNPTKVLQMEPFRVKLAGIIGNELKEKIKIKQLKMEQNPKQAKQLNRKPCIALAELPPEDKREPNAYVLTKTKENWELYYISRMKNEILVNLGTYPAIGELIDEWKEEPVDLRKWKLDTLSELLASLIPNPVVLKLPVGSLGKIAALYKNREAPPASSTETQECRKSENEESRAATALSDGELAAREGLFKSIRTLNKDKGDKDVELATSLAPVEIQTLGL